MKPAVNPTTKQIGDIGEKVAVKELKKKRYKILERNFRARYGEIDIIAQKDGYLVFVEVKTRHEATLSQPYEAVDRRKQRKLVHTAEYYLYSKKLEAYCRFDIIEVFLNRKTLKPVRVNHIKNAFTAESGTDRY